MPLFFDTNVPIGYIFKWDPWHRYANNVFKNKDSKYWSKTVEDETNFKLNEKKEEYLDLLYDLCHQLKNLEGFLKRDDIISLANSSKSNLKLEKRISVIESIWETEGFNYEENSDNILFSLNRTIMDFNHDIYYRKKKFSSNVQLHSRIKKYSKIKKELKEKIHYPDYEIFLDAHDLCSIHKDLEFVTSDYNTENIEYVKSKTSICKITDLRTFVF